MFQGYSRGIESGNLVSGAQCLLFHNILIPFLTGKPLNDLIKTGSEAVWQLEDMGQLETTYIAKMFWQVILNLSGSSVETTKLQGEYFDVETFKPATALLRGYTDLC